MQADAIREESDRLRQSNEDLTEEIEQLQADKCRDIEELLFFCAADAAQQLRRKTRPAVLVFSFYG
jgi:septal ring factor EnvC (AmiA/AmiB activator)